MRGLRTPRDLCQLFNQEKQVVRVSGARLETPVQIPVTGGVILGMYQDRSNTSNIGSLNGSQQSILEQGTAKSGALMFTVNCKPSQNHYRW